jgi:hypothetical protein
MPSVGHDVASTAPTWTGDVAHAPGHQHLPLTGDVREERTPPTVRSRPFAKHRHGLRHPGRA